MIMPFGKYKGTPLNDIPLNYLQWLSEQDDISPRLRWGVEHTIMDMVKEREEIGDRNLTEEERKRLVYYSAEDVEKVWQYYAKYFKSEFHSIDLTVPRFKFNKTMRWMGVWMPFDRVMGFTTYYILPQSRFDNVLLHEMCHQYVTEMGIVDQTPHGKHWRNIASRIGIVTGQIIEIMDPYIYAPNRYDKESLVIVPELVKTEPEKRKKPTQREIDDSYKEFFEENANI